ncbi:M48 family metalloprotease [Paenibacillus kobensis]|uniref:M48 family metalloprotease n=1 Tax=Paenibacillus kobensis TaxID=59841 RepID=UPI0013E3B707|nr:M48 family metalloprotease [Paenibacillus kobensis]
MQEQPKECPACGLTLTVNSGFTVWCTSCEWNIDPDGTSRKNQLGERMARKLGVRWTESLYNNMAYELGAPTATWLRVVSYSAAAFYYVLFLYLMVYGLYLLLFFQSVFGLLLGIAMPLFGFFMRPFGRRKGSPLRLSRQDYPAIYEWVDTLSETMDARPVQEVHYNDSFNASYYENIWGGSRTLTIGMPLLSILSEDEMQALLGHELGHNRHRDLAKHRFTLFALSGLGRLYYELIPKTDWSEWFGPIHHLNVAVRRLLRYIVFAFYSVIGLAVWLDRQKAEYRADEAGAEAGGVRASVSLLQKLHYSETFYRSTERIVHYAYRANIYDEFRERIRYLPELETERIKRLMERASTSVDASHPPTSYRIRHLERRPNIEGATRLALSAGWREQFKEELARLEQSSSKRVLDGWRSHLYS